MTLKEKLFNAIFDNAWEFKTENVIPQCELIADEFAIEFAEWFFDKNWNKNSLSSSEFKKQLEIYKKSL
jgi:hypothetical protein